MNNPYREHIKPEPKQSFSHEELWQRALNDLDRTLKWHDMLTRDINRSIDPDTLDEFDHRKIYAKIDLLQSLVVIMMMRTRQFDEKLEQNIRLIMDRLGA